MYPGSDVRMLGVKIGKITGVTPKGTGVEITMQVDGKLKLPANAAIAIPIVPPSLVSDRYVQLAPASLYRPAARSSPTVQRIPQNRTATRSNSTTSTPR